MAEKKFSSRFCIQFNDSDSRHLQVINILNAQGRHKAQYIVSAVLCYVNRSTASAELQDNATLRQTIQAIVQEFIPPNITDAPNQSCRNDVSGQMVEPINSSSEYDSDMLNSIRCSVSAFRRND